MKEINVPTFVKWAGGKNQLLEQFKNLYPKKIQGYFEPFLGGGAVFFYIKKNHSPKSIHLSDTNSQLINCYDVVRNNPDALTELLKSHKSKHSKEYYYTIRKQDPNQLSPIEAAARFIYLNKTCFNGLYRVNSEGKFNVPIGKYKNPSILNEKTIREASELLQGVKMTSEPFEKIVSKASKGDFIYLDPPYLPLSKTSSFTGYTKDSFSEKDQKRLAEVFKVLDKKGCLLMLSNSDHPLIRSLYSGYRIETVKAGRAICCDPAKRGKITELVVLNY